VSRLPLLALAGLLGPAALPAGGCPVCAAGEPVRAKLFGPDFLPNLGAAVLPAGVLAAVAAAVYGRPGGGRRRA
jgi:hypothetical protein